MSDVVWLGGTSKNPAIDANWEGGSKPADGDTAIFNDQAQQGCDGADLSTGGVTVAVIVEENFIYEIGSVGTPLQWSGFTLLYFGGNGTSSSYFGLGATSPTDFDHVIVDSPSAKSDIVVVSGTIAKWTNRRGKASIDSSATVSSGGRIEVLGTAGGLPSELTIPSGVTVTGTITSVDGGKVTAGASTPTVYLDSGEFVLDGTAGIGTRLEQKGGTFYWDAKSTIALAEVRGGVFKSRKNRVSRTMTEMWMYGDAVVDFRQGGLNTTFTAGIRVCGANQPMMPRGTKFSFAI